MNTTRLYSTTCLLLALLCMVPVVAIAAPSDEHVYWYRGGGALQKSIDALDGEKVEALPLPVLFGVEIKNLTKNYGDPRGTGARMHEGLDIMAPEGTPIVSPTDAVVTRTGDGSGSGLFVATAAPGGETFVYMHLSKIADIAAGDILKPGDLIGYVGYTGNAIASAPHLHFEVRDEDGEPTDPFSRLTTVFDQKEKMKYLTALLGHQQDKDTFSEFLVTKFRSDLTALLAQKTALPESLEAAMKRLGVSSAPATTIPVNTAPTPIAPATVLKVGSRGPDVVTLQTYLLKKRGGNESKIVADGVFGPLTRQAVVAYQTSVGLVADGVAGPKTLATMKQGV